MKIKSYLDRSDALIKPESDEEFRYENGWPFLEIIKNGQTVRLVNKNYIIDMEVENPIPQSCLLGEHVWKDSTHFVKICTHCNHEQKG